MIYGQAPGKSDEWYTPKYIFDALECHFDEDVAAPISKKTHVPCFEYITNHSLDRCWNGFIWMNPPFGGRNGIIPWLDKFFDHGNGIALTPDRTSAPWWQEAAHKSDAVLFTAGKVKFERPNGTVGGSPADGVTLFACGRQAVDALFNAQSKGLGFAALRALLQQEGE